MYKVEVLLNDENDKGRTQIHNDSKNEKDSSNYANPKQAGMHRAYTNII